MKEKILGDVLSDQRNRNKIQSTKQPTKNLTSPHDSTHQQGNNNKGENFCFH